MRNEKGQFIKGHKTWLGKKLSREHIFNIGKNNKRNTGNLNSEETKLKMSLASKGKLKSVEHRKKLSEVKKGKRSNAWKGGITPINHQIRSCFKMRQWISDVFTRDNFTCQDCNKKGGILNAHHIKHFSLIIKINNIKSLDDALLCEELWNINNGRTLCIICHKKYA